MLRLTGKVMSETHYPYGPGSYDTEQLTREVVAAGLRAPSYVNGSGYAAPGSPATSIDVVYDPALTVAEKTVLDAVVAAHKPAGPRKPRTLLAILTDLQALTTTQQQAVWTDFTSGSPAKWAGDAGPNAAALFTQMGVANDLGLSGAALNKARVRAVAFYVQDVPGYLPLSLGINIPGDEPIP
jgi:hypothetical protein